VSLSKPCIHVDEYVNLVCIASFTPVSKPDNVNALIQIGNGLPNPPHLSMYNQSESRLVPNSFECMDISTSFIC